MSLINEALKKAQRQRGGEPLSSAMPGSEPAARVTRREKPMGFNFLVIRFLVGSLLTVFLLLGGYYLYLRMNTPAPAGAQTATTATNPAPAPTSLPANPATAPAPVNAAPAATLTPAPSASATPSTTSSKSVSAVKTAPDSLPPPPVAAVTQGPSPTKPAETSAPTAVVAAPVAEPAPVVPAVAKPPAPTKMDPRAIAFIEGLRVSGIRASGADGKVLMNDRVYRVGDTVEHELGLKLVGIKPNALTFENEAGLRYTRSF